jgi:hypothetical protein
MLFNSRVFSSYRQTPSLFFILTVSLGKWVYGRLHDFMNGHFQVKNIKTALRRLEIVEEDWRYATPQRPKQGANQVEEELRKYPYSAPQKSR